MAHGRLQVDTRRFARRGRASAEQWRARSVLPMLWRGLDASPVPLPPLDMTGSKRGRALPNVGCFDQRPDRVGKAGPQVSLNVRTTLLPAGLSSP